MGEGGKSAIITGAGSGVGRAAAQALAAAGWRVALAGRRLDALHETGDLVRNAGADALTIASDITDPDQVKALFKSVRAAYGRLDLLFNNAGTNIPATPLEELSLAQWSAVVNVNLTGTFLCTREAFVVMKDQKPQGGRIINNGSVSAHVPRPDSAPYTATKHAVTGLTRSTALDGRKYNIACGQIDIGNALTPMAARMTKGVTQADGSTRVEPVMDVANVGQTIAYMAGLPLEANAQFVTVMATAMPFIGRG